MLSHGKMKAFGYRQDLSIIHSKVLPGKNLSISMGSSTPTLSGKTSCEISKIVKITPDAESKDHGENPRVGITPGTRNSALWAKRKKG
jgi:hypothetical protein